jgi:hypothetical protein
MRVRVSYVVDVDDGYRRAIIHHSGGEATADGRATRAEVARWFQQYGETADDDLSIEHGACCWHREKAEDA